MSGFRTGSILLLAAIAALAGCSSATQETLTMPVATMAPVRQPAVTAINVYGEVDNAPRPTPKSIPSAAFRQHTFLTDGADADVSLDPSGQWMTFTSTRHCDRPKIYIQRVDGVTVTQLTSDDADDANPVFSPDGKKIAFASNRSGHWSIYTMDLDGKNSVQITSSRTHDLHPSFSPDGNQLVYSSLGARSDQWELWVVDLTNGARRMVGEGLFPAWCPAKDVNRIAFQRARQRGSRQFSLWTLDLDNGEPRRLTEVATSPNSAIVTPTWSPDGRQIAYATISEPNQHDLWIIDADGTSRRRLTDGVGLALSPVFAPDHRVFYISDRGGSEAVWSLRPAMAPAMEANVGAHDAPAHASAEPPASPTPAPVDPPPAHASNDPN